MGKLLTRGEILSAQDMKSEVVAVPEWGGDVKVRTMTGTERDSMLAAMFVGGKVDREQQTAKLLARCIVDEGGKPIFDEDDIPALGAKSTVALQRVLVVAERLNAVDEAKVDAAEKNS